MKNTKKIGIFLLIVPILLIIIILSTIFIKNNKIEKISKVYEETKSALQSVDGYWSYEIVGGTITLNCYYGSEKELTIPTEIDGHTVTALGRSLFSQTDYTETVIIPNTISRISEFAFEGGLNLKNIKVVEDNSYYCSENGILFTKDKTEIVRVPPNNDLTNYVVPNTVKVIRNNAFKNCNKLIEVEIPDSVNEISGTDTYSSYYSFNGCDNLTSINISPNNSNYSSEDGVFFNKDKTILYCYPCNKNNIEYTIPLSVQTIRTEAFHETKNLKKLIIPSSVESIGNYNFRFSDSLTYIDVDSDSRYFSSEDGVLFNKIKTELVAYPNNKEGTEYTIPTSVTAIRHQAFFYVPNLRKLTIPSTVKWIGSGEIYKNYKSYKNNDVTIYCYRYSGAHKYAIEDSIKYVLLDGGLVSIEVTKNPTKTTYMQNCEQLDLKGGILTLTYEDTGTGTIDLEDPIITTSGFDNTTIGTNTITVTYEGMSTTFDVTIGPKEIDNIKVKANPTKTTYIQNYEELNLEGGILTITYFDDSTEDISMTEDGVTTSGFDNKTLGTKTITISYEGQNATFDIEIVSKILTDISVKKKPSKTSYKQNTEQLNLDGGVLTLRYNDTSIEDKLMTEEGITTDGFDNKTLGTKTITISYEGKTATFEIEIIMRLVYEEKEDGSGMIIEGMEEDYTDVVIPDSIDDIPVTEIGDGAFKDKENLNTVYVPETVTDIADDAFEGSNDVTIECESDSVAEQFAKDHDMNYELVDKVIASISVKTMPNKVVYTKQDTKLDLTGGRLTLTYTDKTTSPINMKKTGVQTTPLDTTEVGQQEIIVTYKGHKTSFNIEIKDNTILLGDINGDGKIDSTDLLLLKRHIIAMSKTEWILTGEKFKRADMNGDEKINSTDLLLLKREIVKK